jgi:hypothetical protein
MFDTSHSFTLVRYGNKSKYTIDLKQIIIAGKPLPFEEGHETIFDSGATYAYLSAATFVAFKDAVRYFSLNPQHPLFYIIFQKVFLLDFREGINIFQKV